MKSITDVVKIIQAEFHKHLETYQTTTVAEVVDELSDRSGLFQWPPALVSAVIQTIYANELIKNVSIEYNPQNLQYRLIKREEVVFDNTIYLDNFEQMTSALLAHAGKKVKVTWQVKDTSWRTYTGNVISEVSKKGYIQFYTEDGLKQIVPSGLSQFEVQGQIYKIR